ncbi:Fe2+-dependent dioxygenase [Aquirhabdus sp.]|uniref:Fe2+-dependent dioxygenase n=1 Tax=Aquirhabdus sp. TaxID=2824160 RepID=UPI00396C3BAE
MLLQIPNVLSPEQVNACKAALIQTEWADGKITAGYQSGKAKHNLQLPEDNLIAREWSALILKALEQHQLFIAAALPLKIFPPLFNCYQGGGHFGLHVDNAIRDIRAQGFGSVLDRVRTDISATLFLSEPDEYEGGELLIEDTYGAKSVKLPAGHMILYPSTSLHKVNPVTQGARIASFFWIQSLVRDDAQRTVLFDLDQSIQHLTLATSEHPSLVQLTGVYHNLLRMWSDV